MAKGKVKNKEAELKEAIVPQAGEPVEKIAFRMEDAKKYFDPKGLCDDMEIALFLRICKENDLNPFKREAHLVKYSPNAPAQIIIGYETYLRRAANSGRWNGEKCWTEGEGKDLKACINIFIKGWENPFYHEVFLREYERQTTIWREKPITMLKKIVRAQAYRLAFPIEAGGLPYIEEEFPALPEVKTKPRVDEPKALIEEKAAPMPSPTFVASDGLPETSMPDLKDLDEKIRESMKKRGISASMARRNLSAEFSREIKSVKDLTVLEKIKVIKILEGNDNV